MRVGASALGAQDNGVSSNPSISGDGRFITFNSDASNLIAGNLEPLPVVADPIQTHTFASPGVVATSIDVQQGANQRSFIQYVDLSFANPTSLDQWYGHDYLDGPRANDADRYEPFAVSRMVGVKKKQVQTSRFRRSRSIGT